MECEIEYRDGLLHAAGDMNIYSAVQMKAALLDSLKLVQGDLQLDLSRVVELDSCGLQILLLALREQQRRGCRLTVVEPSPVVREVLALTGMTQHFGVGGHAA